MHFSSSAPPLGIDDHDVPKRTEGPVGEERGLQRGSCQAIFIDRSDRWDADLLVHLKMMYSTRLTILREEALTSSRKTCMLLTVLLLRKENIMYSKCLSCNALLCSTKSTTRQSLQNGVELVIISSQTGCVRTTRDLDGASLEYSRESTPGCTRTISICVSFHTCFLFHNPTRVCRALLVTFRFGLQ